MAIPSYVEPTGRSAWEPNPFDLSADARRPFRVLLDQPLTVGDADGQGIYAGPVFAGDGPPGFPDASSVLRAYAAHAHIDVLFISEDPNADGGVVLDSPNPDRDELTFVYDKYFADGSRKYEAGIDNYRDYAELAQAQAARFNLPIEEALAGVLLPAIGNQLECDAIVTCRPWLLSQRDAPRQRHLQNVMSPEDALALASLCLRWHGDSAIIGGGAVRWGQRGPRGMRGAAVHALLPNLWRWGSGASRGGTPTDAETRKALVSSCVTRVARVLGFRDAVHALSLYDHRRNAEEMLEEFDSMLYSLVGAFDITARVASLDLGMRTAKHRIGWLRKEWRDELKNKSIELFDLTAPGTPAHQAMRVAAALRNTVHNAALRFTTQQDLDGERILVTMSPDEEMRILQELGAASADWGIATSATGRVTLDAARYTEKLIPAALSETLDKIMRTTAAAASSGPPAKMQNGCQWYHAETAAHRLRLLYGLP